MRAHRRADIGEHTHESTHMRAQRGTHMRSQEREAHFVRAGAGKIHMDMSEEPFCIEMYKKMPNPNPRTPILCEPAQSKRTWTFHNVSQETLFFSHLQEEMPHITPPRALTLTA